VVAVRCRRVREIAVQPDEICVRQALAARRRQRQRSLALPLEIGIVFAAAGAAALSAAVMLLRIIADLAG